MKQCEPPSQAFSINYPVNSFHKYHVRKYTWLKLQDKLVSLALRIGRESIKHIVKQTFKSYDFETLRKSFIDYIRLYYPESYNDYIESSEFIALLDVMAFMGQAGSFRNDLNTRENFIDTAERRDSVVRLAELVSYTPKRNTASQGFIKVTSISTTEGVIDFTGVNLSNITVNWNDTTNTNWLEQFTVIVNAAFKWKPKIWTSWK